MFQTAQILRLQNSFAKMPAELASRAQSSMSNNNVQTVAPEPKKNKVITEMQTRLEKIQTDFQTFLKTVESLKSSIDNAERTKKEAAQAAQQPAKITAQYRSNIEENLAKSPLDAILDDIRRPRHASPSRSTAILPNDENIDPLTASLGGTFDYASANRMMEEIKGVRKQIAANIRPTMSPTKKHNVTLLDLDNHGGEKTHLSEGIQ
jgi:hypothetical protein